MTLSTPAGYRPLDDASLRRFLADLPDLAAKLGGAPSDWSIVEVGDGNLNLVFLIDGPAGSLCVKQSLPYVRAAGESWPLPLDRAFFEQAYYRAVAPFTEGLTPRFHHYDPALYAIVMERLSPHIILRRGLIEGRRYPDAARAVAEFSARSTFATSDLGARIENKAEWMATFARNTALIRITAEVVFTDPLAESPRNRWTSPALDAIAAEFRSDSALKVTVAEWGRRFLTTSEALIHGDLHSGSVMVSETDTRVMDPEFAFVGPIGFDVGAFIANLAMNAIAQAGHAAEGDDRRAEAHWVLEQIPVFWNTWRARFLALWEEGGRGDAYPSGMFAKAGDTAPFAAAREAYVDRIFADAIGYAGVKTIRRILGFAHNADFELIADPLRRAPLEARALHLARRFLMEPQSFRRAEDVVAAVREG
ncbi:S-methyl-5-thioribose kinase [Kaistia geumhonensis]|uniref:S-methyl-5-thioribose kinase n=1 Tax=Kaistia geumhonensis TaxID=410839 RepID=A0ABU0M4Y1_9HYPH|nr:S-methyl-5-thioribose kinase [Kaistia geumhonensis]MCX5478886.1 S-methyl-5-thioribose kinase [Kaistia geumhonensis]MDQ0515895.1 5-methylthioribose kinase [Kaistia geumhonensis]